MHVETPKKHRPKKVLQASSFLQSLARNRSGNTLVMMAAFTIPLVILAGAGIDIGRQFLVKTRLQQACDAGALAGRKTMTATTGTALDTNSAAQAQLFFSSNFRSGWMGSSAVSFTPTRTNDSQVTATATATVPMTLTRMFNNNSVVQTVSCTARFDIGDTDIMFVLDTTGSMADSTSGCSAGSAVSYTRPDGTTGYRIPECTSSKMAGLRTAVLSFYDTLAAHASPAAHVRYGFVTYTSTVNAGLLLPASYIVDSYGYNTRQLIGDADYGTATTSTPAAASSAACSALAVRAPTTGYTATGTAVQKTASWNSSTNVCTITGQPKKPNWRYGKYTQDTSQFKLGSAIADPSVVTGGTTKWQGCIEERDTTVTTTFNQNSLPADLNPDTVPTSDATRWRPLWPDVTYFRGNVMSPSTVDNSGSSTNPYGDTTSTSAAGAYTNVSDGFTQSAQLLSCGKPAKRLAVMTRTEVSNFVNATDFVPIGYTYHDTGMIWGTRLISPTGIFASDTAAWPGNTSPARYIVFMTDGAMNPNSNVYGMYGLEYYDKRIAGSTGTSLTTYHNARFVAECAAAKARNITVFVIGFGQALTTEMTNCASPGSAFYASSNSALQDAFNSIALNVAALRLSQ